MVTRMLTGVDENHWSEPSADHISMHFEDAKSSREAGHHEFKGIIATIEDLQRSQAAIQAEFQSLRQETTVPQALQGPQGSPYLTNEDIHAILFEVKKMESVVYVDTRPLYPKEIARKPYLANYTTPKFTKYNCITWNARKHIKRYVDALTAHSHDHDLRLRKFSKSLEGCKMYSPLDRGFYMELPLI